MEELWASIVSHLRDKSVGIAVATLFGVVGWYFGTWRAWRKWRRREFFDRVNVSLNVIREGKLLIRTIMEKNGEEIFLNKSATDTLLAAAKSTTAKNPIIPLEKDDYWYYLNSVLNEVGEKFAIGQIRRDVGQPIAPHTYLICLTNECAGELRTRKIRAMLVLKSVLQNLPEKQPTFESPHHITRWETLQILAKEYAAKPYQFIEIEMVV